MNNDYVVYIDTDSLYVGIGDFLIKQGISKEHWDVIPQDKQIEFIKRLQEPIKEYINNQSMERTQKQHYNSQVDDFGIVFEPEKICLSGIYASKKRYANWVLINDGDYTNDMKITGMEIVRSDSPEIVKPMIKKILKMILTNVDDNIISDYIAECRIKLKNCTPEEISENKGVNKLNKYLDGFNCKKGTPHHVRGIANMRRLVEELNLGNKYNIPTEGNKAKVVYVTKNKYRIGCLSFTRWPSEFGENKIYVDYETMIYKNFIKKITGLLEIVNKTQLIEEKNEVVDLLFG